MDYAALAKQYGGTTTAPAVDYAALAKQYGGITTGTSTSEWDNPPAQSVGMPPDTTPQWGRKNPNLYSVAQGARKYLGPTLEAGSAIAGAALGTALAPGPGTVGGAGLGYGIGTGITKLADVALGNVPPETAPQAFTRGAKDVLTGATLEAGGAVAGQVLSKAAQAAGWVWDAVSGKLVNVRAGKIARDIAGADLGTIKDLAKSAGPNLTAAQATQPVGSNVLAALGEKAAKNDVSNFFSRTAAEQEAARAATLRGVTPDLKTVQAARSTSAATNYPAAFTAGVDQKMAAAMQPQIDNLMARPVMQAAKQDTVEWAANNGLATPDFGSVAGLDYMKKALDRQIASAANAAARGGTAVAKADLATLMQNKNDLLATLKELSPLYDVARAKFAAQSAPVNQSQILGAMQDVLAKPGGGERVVPFLNALGTGENALIKRAGGNPRFGGLEDVLTPQQMGTVNDIAGQFTRDLELARSAAAGKGGLSRILGEAKSTVELPPSIGLYTRTVNKVLSVLEGKVNTDTVAALEKGMRSGKDLLVMLNTLPTSERVAAFQALSQAPGKQLGQAATYTTNALVRSQQNQNALAP